jgi:hypothetical protein
MYANGIIIRRNWGQSKIKNCGKLKEKRKKGDVYDFMLLSARA